MPVVQDTNALQKMKETGREKAMDSAILEKFKGMLLHFKVRNCYWFSPVT